MPLTVTRRITQLTLCALLPSAAAQSQFLSPSLNTLLAPPALGVQDPDITLSRAPGELEIVTDAATGSAAVARRYGLSPSAVKTVAAGGMRVVRLPLPVSAVADDRLPVRPPTVKTYTARPGDTMAGVASRFGTTLIGLLGLNLTRTSLDHLRVGDTLNVPTGSTGVLVRIKPGQSALSLIAGYGADLLETAQANRVLPTELRVGDELLLPGIRADGFAQELAQKRERQRLAALEAQRLHQYQAYLSWKQGRERARLEAQYRAQQQYEDFLAWKTSPQRQARVAALQRQVQFEAAQASRAARVAQAAQEARTRAAQLPRAQAYSPQARAALTVRSAGTAPQRSGLAWPMRSFRITSRFGEADIAFHQQVFHGGVDFAAPYGTPIYAASDGQVTQAGYGAFGLNVYTQSGDSTIIYGHMSRAAVVAGQSVAQGQLLGYIGCTGMCTGPHLHFEVRLSGRAVDPLALLP